MDREEAYNRGYEDGFEGRDNSPSSVPPSLEVLYVLGHDNGSRDREDVQRAYSSNS